MDKASLMSNAFIAIKEDDSHHNQIKGAEMMAYFNDKGALRRFDVLGGANALFYLEENGALASLNSVAKIRYEDCRDGISNTFSITPEALGRNSEERVDNLTTILDGYFANMAHHINVNVLNRETLIKAYEDPSAYPNLTIRVSGYAVNFHKLSREQQKEVISRTFHEVM
jgi:formate C-acetyltransferase